LYSTSAAGQPASSNPGSVHPAGTSAATPVTTGVIALMLDAAPGLGWRDVQNILALSALSALSAQGAGSRYGGSNANENFSCEWNGAANWNGGRTHFSED
jgi:subtilisin family serine protease